MLGNSGLFGAVIGTKSGDRGRCFESSNLEWYNHYRYQVHFIGFNLLNGPSLFLTPIKDNTILPSI